MRNMRKWMTGLLAVAMLLSLAACSGGEQATPETESSGQGESNGQEITLVADFSSGSEQAEEFDLIQRETRTVEEATPGAMAQALSEWSGLDFTLNSAAVEEGAVTVDWAADSTLVAGLDDREQKEEFSFHDIDSLRWFMMDSLYSTLTANLGEVEVYYTMDGGQDLSFDELYPVNLFPADTPYLGSPFYFAHAGGQGETDGFDFSRTEGTWWLDGEEDTASIYMDGEGGFIAYYASGSVEAAGYLEYVDEYGDGNGRYDMYDGELGWINGFYFDSDTQIHMGNGDGPVYIRMDGEPADTPAPGALMYSPGFTGLTPADANNDFHGGYYYEDLLDGSLAIIVTAAVANDFMSAGEETMEEYIARWAEVICGWEIRDLAVQDGGTMGSYPTSRVTWMTGGNEDTRHWDALMVFTDLYTYFYGFNMSADYAGELDDLREDVFSQLELVFPEE